MIVNCLALLRGNTSYKCKELLLSSNSASYGVLMTSGRLVELTLWSFQVGSKGWGSIWHFSSLSQPCYEKSHSPPLEKVPYYWHSIPYIMKLDIFLDPGWKFSMHGMVFHRNDSQSTRPMSWDEQSPPPPNRSYCCWSFWGMLHILHSLWSRILHSSALKCGKGFDDALTFTFLAISGNYWIGRHLQKLLSHHSGSVQPLGSWLRSSY